MEISRRVQTIIALISGTVFGALLVATLMQNYYRNNIDQLIASQTGQTKQAEQSPTPSTADETPAAQDNAPLAESTTTPNEAAPEQTPQAPIASTETNTEPTRQSQPTQIASEKKPAAPTEFTYTAQVGDSYSLLARKAIQSYANSQKVTLSPAQAVAAEAFLSESAGSPELNEGQGVTINANDVKSAVERAQKLPAEELAIWDIYAQDVVFEAGANS